MKKPVLIHLKGVMPLGADAMVPRTTLASSIEALELFRSKRNEYDFGFTDMSMPNIPIILSTGCSKKISDKHAAQIGIKAFVMKPSLKIEPAKTVRNLL